MACKGLMFTDVRMKDSPSSVFPVRRILNEFVAGMSKVTSSSLLKISGEMVVPYLSRRWSLSVDIFSLDRLGMTTFALDFSPTIKRK